MVEHEPGKIDLALPRAESAAPNPERLVIEFLDFADLDPPTIRTHTIEVDLGLSDPSRVPQRVGVSVRACYPARNCLRHHSRFLEMVLDPSEKAHPTMRRDQAWRTTGR